MSRHHGEPVISSSSVNDVVGMMLRGVSLTCLNGSGRCYVDLQSRSIDGGDQRWSGCPLPLLELAQT